MREWYAGLAMQGILAGDPDMHPFLVREGDKKILKGGENLVAEAFAIADAMIAHSRKDGAA